MEQLLYSQNRRIKKEDGNVLFLILIAVALFAALSYAVTSSTRSGGGDASRETLQLSYDRIQNHVATLRTAATRMIMNGVPVEELRMEHPNWALLSTLEKTYNIYDPTGGNIPWEAFQNLGVSPQATARFQIDGIGKTFTPDSTGNEIIYLLSGLPESLCTLINQKNGISGIPDDNFMLDSTGMMMPISVAGTGIAMSTYIPTLTSLGLYGKAEGCLRDTAIGELYYYAVIVER